MPTMVARRIFRIKLSTVSSARATTSERLQNCFDLRIISPQGLVPSSLISPFRVSILLLGRVLAKPPRLKMPRSPEPLFIKATHSSINSGAEGF